MAKAPRNPTVTVEPTGRELTAPEAMPPTPEAASTDRPPVPPPALGKTYRSSEAAGRLASSGPVASGPMPILGRSAVPPGMIHGRIGGHPVPAAFGHAGGGRPAMPSPPAFTPPPRHFLPGPMSPAPARAAVIPPQPRHPGEVIPPTVEPATRHRAPHDPQQPLREGSE